MEPRPGGEKLRFLCFHGMRTSAAILKIQLRDFPSDLVEFVYLDGTFPATGEPDDLVKAFFRGPYYEWWTISDKSKQLDQMRATLDYISAIAQAQGPFHGVLGFSMGACLAATLLAMSAKEPDTCPIPNLKYAIILSGFVPKSEVYAPYFDQVLHRPALLIHGATDFLKADSEHLAAKFSNVQLLTHSGGHQPPTNKLGPEVMATLRSTVQSWHRTEFDASA